MEGREVRLQARCMSVLVHLAQSCDRVVTTDELMDKVWGDINVTLDSLYLNISYLRKALAEDPENLEYIETIPKSGYRLIAPVIFPDIENVAPTELISQFTGRRVGIITVALVVLALFYVAFDRYVNNPTSDEAIAGDHSIAVLPFVNMSDDPGNEYFADGITEEILNLLTRVPNLKVIGRTSSFTFKGRNDDLRTIGRILGVKTLLEGSVRKEGDRVRIVAQLIDVADGTHIWSDTYDRRLDDVFAVQDDVASAVLDAMKIYVTAGPQRGRPTDNWEAYSYFLRARVSANARNFRQAEILLREAVKLDPNFAEAYELIAICYWHIGFIPVDLAVAQRRSFDAASTAIEINPALVFAQALVRLGNVGSSSTLKELEAMEWALGEQPDNLQAFNGLVYDLGLAGYLDEALITAQRWVEKDPFSLDANMDLFITLYAAGSTEDAWRRFDLIYQMNLEPANWEWTIAGLKLAEGHDEAAIEYFEALLHQHNYQNTAWVRELVTAARDPVSGQAYFDRRIPEIAESLGDEDTFNWRVGLTDWYLFAGFIDRYYELILADNPTSGAYTDADDKVWHGHMLRRLGFTAHPDYLSLATDLGIVEVWEQRGPPDFCEKLNGQWVCE